MKKQPGRCLNFFIAACIAMLALSTGGLRTAAAQQSAGAVSGGVSAGGFFIPGFPSPSPTDLKIFSGIDLKKALGVSLDVNNPEEMAPLTHHLYRLYGQGMHAERSEEDRIDMIREAFRAAQGDFKRWQILLPGLVVELHAAALRAFGEPGGLQAVKSSLEKFNGLIATMIRVRNRYGGKYISNKSVDAVFGAVKAYRWDLIQRTALEFEHDAALNLLGSLISGQESKAMESLWSARADGASVESARWVRGGQLAVVSVLFLKPRLVGEASPSEPQAVAEGNSAVKVPLPLGPTDIGNPDMRVERVPAELGGAPISFEKKDEYRIDPRTLEFSAGDFFSAIALDHMRAPGPAGLGSGHGAGVGSGSGAGVGPGRRDVLMTESSDRHRMTGAGGLVKMRPDVAPVEDVGMEAGEEGATKKFRNASEGESLVEVRVWNTASRGFPRFKEQIQFMAESLRHARFPQLISSKYNLPVRAMLVLTGVLFLLYANGLIPNMGLVFLLSIGLVTSLTSVMTTQIPLRTVKFNGDIFHIYPLSTDFSERIKTNENKMGLFILSAKHSVELLTSSLPSATLAQALYLVQKRGANVRVAFSHPKEGVAFLKDHLLLDGKLLVLAPFTHPSMNDQLETLIDYSQIRDFRDRFESVYEQSPGQISGDARTRSAQVIPVSFPFDKTVR